MKTSAEIVNASADSNIAALVAALPEIYQPIFSHPALSQKASRQCEDRLEHIAEIYQALAKELGRPLRVLDIGCAQGYFGLNLAALGATVTGIDFQSQNIAVCRALAAEHPECDIQFEIKAAEETIATLADDGYDLVLGLSVFHHMVHRLGIGPVQKMLSFLASKTGAGIFEMALPSEPPYWASSQPDNPRDLLSGYSFVHEFAHMGNHLSTIERPLFFASNRYWFLDSQLGVFDSFKTESHVLAQNASLGTRRYFFGKELVIKIFDLGHKDRRKANADEHANEVSFLRNPPAGYPVPRMLTHGSHEKEVWLAREMWGGELLVDLMRAGTSYDPCIVVCDVLEQLAALQNVGLYHDDVRVWNILMDVNGRARLIDYGAISKAGRDVAWPYNVFLAFAIFMYEVMGIEICKRHPSQTFLLHSGKLPVPYEAALFKLLEQPPAQWRFADLRSWILSPEPLVKIVGSHEELVKSFDVPKQLEEASFSHSLSSQKMNEVRKRIELVRSDNLKGEAGRLFDQRMVEKFWDAFIRPGPVVDMEAKADYHHSSPLFRDCLGLDPNTPGYNGRDLPYADGTIGSIHASHFLQHIGDYGHFLRESLRVLTPAGTLLIFVPLMEAFEKKKTPPSNWKPEPRRFYTASRLLAEIETSLPREAYRIIHLRERFRRSDLALPPDKYSSGPYEIECVLEKLPGIGFDEE